MSDTLHSVSIFQGLTGPDLEILSRLFVPEQFRAEQLIFAQGDPAEKLYLLTRGKVAIRFKPYDGEALLIAEIEPGGVFGWSAALDRRTYTSCAVALVESEGLGITGPELRGLYRARPDLGEVVLLRLAEVLAKRLRNTHAHVLSMLREGMQSGPGH